MPGVMFVVTQLQNEVNPIQDRCGMQIQIHPLVQHSIAYLRHVC